MRLFLLLCYLKRAFGIAMLLLSFVAAGQERFNRIGVDDGLPNATIYSVQQDKTGYLWLGSTNSGLLRYDGYRFTEYPLLTPEELLRHQTPDVGVVLISEDDDIWAGTWGMGLSRFDAQSTQLVRFTQTSGLAGNYIQTLFKDSRNRVWVGTTTGLSRINTDLTISNIGSPAQDNALADQRIWSLTQAADGTVWIGTSAGLHFWREDTGLSAVIELVPGADALSRQNEIRALLYSQGELWLGSRSGLFRYSPQHGQFRRRLLVADGQTEPVINVLRRSNDNSSLLVGSYNGLFRFTPASSDTASEQLLANVNVRSILQDRSGVLWLGSRESGLYRSIVASAAFFDIQSLSAALAQQAPFSVTALLHQASYLWLGSADAVYRIDLLTGQYQHFPLGSRVNALAADPQQQVYIATDNGLWRFSDAEGLQTIEQPFELSGVVNRNVRDISVGSDGTVYIGMWGEGVISWQPATSSVQHMLADLSESSVGNSVQQLHLGQQNRLWVATRYSGLFLLDTASGEVKQFSTANTAAIRITHNNVQCVQEYETYVAVCTREGLLLADLKSNSQQLLTEQDGLPSNNVLGVLQHQGELWVMTAKGLGYRSETADHFFHLNKHDGMISSELNTNAIAIAADNLYLGSVGGVIRLQPSKLRTNIVIPQPVLSAVTIDHHETTLKPHSKAWPLITLAPENHTLNFEFSALDFQDPTRNQFQYQLEGINPDWVMAGTNNSAFYANLPAGTYALWLKAANNHGMFSAPRVVATIQVLPYWWQKTWVQLFGAGLAIALLWLMHLYRIRHVRQINRLLQAAVDAKARAQVVLETRVAERTQALEESSVTLSLRTQQLEQSLAELADTNRELTRLDQLKDDFIATVSHELRTPLTAIRGAVGLLSQQVLAPGSDAYQQMLHTAQNSSERLGQLINDLLDLQKFASGKFSLTLAELDLAALAQQAVQGMLPYASRYNVELTLHCDSTDDCWVNADAFRLRQVMDNLISNAIKFSTEHAEVTVQVSCGSQSVRFEVANQGEEIPAEFQSRIFEKFSQADSSDTRAKDGTGLGLAICKSIIEHHRGEISFQSQQGQGTVFWFVLNKRNPALG